MNRMFLVCIRRVQMHSTNKMILLTLCYTRVSWDCLNVTVCTAININYTVRNTCNKITPFKQIGCAVHWGSLKIAWFHACNLWQYISFSLWIQTNLITQNKLPNNVIFKILIPGGGELYSIFITSISLFISLLSFQFFT